MISARWATWLAIIIMMVAWPTENLPLWMAGCAILIKVVGVKTEKYQSEVNPYKVVSNKTDWYKANQH